MPSKSNKQHRFMEAVKHNPKFAKKVGVPQSVGADFVAADKRTGAYARGGGVLGSYVPRQPDRKMGIPERNSLMPAIGNADKAIIGSRTRLGALMQRARGGRTRSD